ncbi:NnrS family protein [Martelella soudanensis]|uniref:NnrS family protein n=1 Tax=Martelella sp. NC20 TaxID=2740298 RepID=UPI001FEDB649|nr:NnrS family protein [Martelella sp. NC20]
MWPQAVPPAVALHAWTAGAVGVMTRATRGHSGRPLTSPRTTTLIYLLVILSVVLRLATIILPDRTATLHELAAAAWTAAFVAFVVFYGPMLLRAWARKKT